MKVISIGDNVVDCYLDQQTFYPGGNAVNVAVNCKRYGAEESTYIGVFGNDEPAEHIKACLEAEGIDYSFSRKVYASSGMPRVALDKDGDRIFVGGPKDTVQHILRLKLIQKDFDYISTFDICHTSCYSNIEAELEKLSKLCRVSFDFSDDFTLDYVKAVSPKVKFAFFSGSGRKDEEINELIDIAHSSKVEIMGVTLGSKGALFIKDGKRYLQSVKPVQVVDTMGAGDSFIAGFITSYADHGNMEKALDFAADCAAKTCTSFGGFGYPHQFGGII